MLENDSGHQLQVTSPVDGEVVAVNPVYFESPGTAIISSSDTGRRAK
jgi:glycine cleavage system H lipoate-binding protein